jgi:hypothetical protein
LFYKILERKLSAGRNESYHEERVIGTSADDPDLDPVLGIPLKSKLTPSEQQLRGGYTYTSKPVEHIDVFTSVKIIDGTFTVNFKSI